jgi:hypothetical protein
MADFENSSAVDLGALFYSQQSAPSGATEGFRKASYGGVLTHRFNHLPQPIHVELQALSNLGVRPQSAPRRDGSKLA